MTEQKKIYKVYLVLAIIYSVLTLCLNGISLLRLDHILPNLMVLLIFFIDIGWVFFSAVMFVVILIKKIEKIALIIPALYIIDFIFALLTSIIEVIIKSDSLIFPLIAMILPGLALVVALKLILRK